MSDEPDDLAENGLWLSVAELARQRNITRQSAAERVDRLEAEGKLTTRRDGRSKLVNLAEFDLAIGEAGDAAREAAAETKAEAEPDETHAPAAPAFRDHQTREKQYAADLKFIELQRELGRLVPADQVAEAAARCAEKALAVIERLSTYSDTLAAAVAQDGANGARAKLKEITRDIRQGVADAMRDLASSAASPAMIQSEEDDAG